MSETEKSEVRRSQFIAEAKIVHERCVKIENELDNLEATSEVKRFVELQIQHRQACERKDFLDRQIGILTRSIEEEQQ
mgnify:FL=1